MIVKLRLICIFLYILLDYRVNGTYIYFYRRSNWTDLYHNSSIHSGCNQFPDPNTRIHTVITDTCVILYEGELGTKCEATKIDIRNRRAQNISSGYSTNYLKNITGFRLCEEDYGKLQLNIDIVEQPYVIFVSTSGQLVSKMEFMVVKTHRDVCSCVNIDERKKRNGGWAIRNHDHEYVAYFERDCKEEQLKAKLVSARQTWFSRRGFITKDEAFTTRHPIKSFGPSLNSSYYKHSCNMKFKNFDLQNKTNGPEKTLPTAILFNEIETRMITTQQKQNDEIRKLEKTLKETAITFKESQTNMIAIQQTQNIKIHKLEERYNETESKLESNQNTIMEKLTELRNELDDRVGLVRDD